VNVETFVRRLDRMQQSNRVVAPIVGVIKKFGDDRGSSLAVLITYYGFMSLFPLLLLLTTVLGFIGNARLEHNVIGTTLAEFPVVGEQIGKQAPRPLTGSPLALAVGIGGLLYGSLGIAQAGQHAMAEVWNVPGAVRPNFPRRLVRCLTFLGVLAVALGVSSVINGLATLGARAMVLRAALVLLSVAVNVALMVAIFRVWTPDSVPSRPLVPGAVFAGVGYSILLTVGTVLVQHQLRHAEAVYGQFAFVLGLIAWLSLVAQLIVYCAEWNVVLTKRLWPRSIVQPPLTPADERVLGDVARQEARRPEQQVDVGFSD
jgi:YihY family inner membrane protein